MGDTSMEKEQLQKFFNLDSTGLPYSRMPTIMPKVMISVEAFACPYNDANTVIKFLKRQIFSRYGVHRVLINDGGSHFCNAQLAKVLKHYEVKHKVASPYQPQTNGQAEVSNRDIKRILEKTVASLRKDWSQKLDDALWVYKTAMKTLVAMSVFQLAYGKRKRQLLKLEDMCLHAYDASKSYKEKFKFYHDRKLVKKILHLGQQVLMFNSRLKLFPGNLKYKWSGSFTIKDVKQHGAIGLMDSSSDDPQRSWMVNGQRLKHYFGGEVERLTTIIQLVDP
ncbi:uncharacterized protein LOC124822976 [Vigna umbellata]|uniref:uncharacterized protein LOC124822976 n=1 Tax=Vigna umbellata TaxID=87088 RepID=UPI001F5F43C3|nr:uncharacterized protein LOC124822976 [Vigna umbellata]